MFSSLGPTLAAWATAFLGAFLSAALDGFLKVRKQNRALLDKGAADQKSAQDKLNAEIADDAAKTAKELAAAPDADVRAGVQRWRL